MIILDGYDKRFVKKSFQFWLCIILGAILSILVTAYSAYAGLKIGGVYWPILATSVTSLAILKISGKKDANLANIMQTAGNTGGMVAAGIIFTIPAAWMLGIEFTYIQITLIALIGSLLGLLFSLPLRKNLLHLPYPDGTAAAVVLQSSQESTDKIKILLYSLLTGGVVAYLRDGMLLLRLSFIGLAGGFLIGGLFTGVWFFGAMVSYFVLSGVDRIALTNAGIGIIIGTALAYIFTDVLPLLKTLAKGWRRGYLGLIFVAIVLIASFTHVSLVITVFAIGGAFLMASVAGFVTGQLNIDPMEIFAIIVLLAVKFLLPADFSQLVTLAAIVTLAAGTAGDVMQDYKTGSLLNTPYQWQTVAQIAGRLTASLVIGLIIIAIAKTSGFGNAQFPAPQATAIAAIVKTQTVPPSMLIGIVLGGLAAVGLSFFKLGLAPIVFGIGMYVPFSLSLSLFLGGAIRLWSDYKKRTETNRLIAAGLIAGESLVGVLLTLISFVKNLL